MDKKEGFFSRLFKSKDRESPKTHEETTYWPSLEIGDPIKMISAGGDERAGTIRKRLDLNHYEAALDASLTADDSVRPGEEATIYYLKNNRSYGVLAEILTLFGGETETMVEFYCRAALARNQRREYFRYPLRVQVLYRPCDAEGFADHRTAFTEGYTLDISGGGMRVKTAVRMAVGTELQCRIMIGDEVLPVSARIVRERALHLPGEYELGICFQRISESVRNRIIRYIFAEQRRFNSKENLLK